MKIAGLDCQFRLSVFVKNLKIFVRNRFVMWIKMEHLYVPVTIRWGSHTSLQAMSTETPVYFPPSVGVL